MSSLTLVDQYISRIPQGEKVSMDQSASYQIGCTAEELRSAFSMAFHSVAGCGSLQMNSALSI